MDCHDYVLALEEERRKIRVFQRELPLCLELVTQTIEACKQQLSGTTTEQSECSSDHRLVLEEFIPINPCSDEREREPHNQSTNSGTDKKKSDWLRSVQLWNQNPDPPTHQDVGSEKEAAPEQKGGAFKPLREEKSNVSPVVKPPCSVPASSSKKEDKEGERKQRRCWSPELHRRFLEALEQLGGSHAATPKQIRELMKVEGLSNDEVKSHLQKYRLHTRRPSSGNVPKQFVVVGGIWVPPPTAVSGQVTTTNGVYAPVAARPQPTMVPHQQTQSDQERRSHSSEGVHSHSHSQSTSSTTDSHVL